jgi:hypothetical protein
MDRDIDLASLTVDPEPDQLLVNLSHLSSFIAHG